MENNQEEFYNKMGAYFWLWRTVCRGMEDSLTHDDLTDHERFEKLGAIRVIQAMLDDLYSVFPYPEPEPPVYQYWETA